MGKTFYTGSLTPNSSGSSGGTSIYSGGTLKTKIAIDEETLSVVQAKQGVVSSSNENLNITYSNIPTIQDGTYEFTASSAVIQYDLDLTSDGTPGGSNKAAACSTYESGHPAYYAFDNSSATTWGPSDGKPNEWVMLYDPNGIQIKTISWLNGSYSEIFPITLIQGSNDNINFTTIYTYDLGQDPVTDLAVNADITYKYIRFFFPQPGNYGKFTLTGMTVEGVTWSLDGNIVNLADYGITYIGNAVEEDVITLTINTVDTLTVKNA